MRAALLRAIHWFPKGSIKQTRYVALPMALAASAIALAVYGDTFWFVVGLIAWTPIEYVMHRWVLHYQPKGEIGTELLKRFHILHHDHPADQSQVCIPPTLEVPAAALTFGLLVLAGAAQGPALLFTLGLFLMMVIYDIAHFTAHYEPPRNAWTRMLKKHHMLHHFSDHRARFGVTSPVWDYVFRTER